MKRSLAAVVVCAALALPAGAQDWSFGAATGPFVFGDFVRRTLRTGTEAGSGEQKQQLSAKTRPGLAIDLERRFSDRFAIRLEGTFTHAPLAIKGSSDSGGVTLESGTINVATAMVPLVFRFNPHGTFRFHAMGGPAYAIYDISNRSANPSTLRTFTGERTRWGVALGGGVGWYWSERFAVEGQLTDISTTSPFRRSEFAAGLARIEIPRTHNVHTTIGIRYGF
jgi:opacity protein-like surface antigen